MIRLLLPFTHGIDEPAIANALALARHLDATLLLLSLIDAPSAARQRPKWEAIQQSQDFLEFAQHKATRSGIAIERMELYTHNVIRSIRALAYEMDCAGIVLIVRQGSGVLLATPDIKHLLEDKNLPLYILPLQARTISLSLPSWVPRFGKKRRRPIA